MSEKFHSAKNVLQVFDANSLLLWINKILLILLFKVTKL